MKRRTKKRTVPVHVTIPVRTLEDLDETLSFKASRSKVITRLIDAYLDGGELPASALTVGQLLAAAMARLDRNSTEYIMLETVFNCLGE